MNNLDVDQKVVYKRKRQSFPQSSEGTGIIINDGNVNNPTRKKQALSGKDENSPERVYNAESELNVNVDASSPHEESPNSIISHVNNNPVSVGENINSSNDPMLSLASNDSAMTSTILAANLREMRGNCDQIDLDSMGLPKPPIIASNLNSLPTGSDLPSTLRRIEKGVEQIQQAVNIMNNYVAQIHNSAFIFSVSQQVESQRKVDLQQKLEDILKGELKRIEERMYTGLHELKGTSFRPDETSDIYRISKDRFKSLSQHIFGPRIRQKLTQNPTNALKNGRPITRADFCNIPEDVLENMLRKLPYREVTVKRTRGNELVERMVLRNEADINDLLGTFRRKDFTKKDTNFSRVKSPIKINWKFKLKGKKPVKDVNVVTISFAFGSYHINSEGKEIEADWTKGYVLKVDEQDHSENEVENPEEAKDFEPEP